MRETPTKNKIQTVYIIYNIVYNISHIHNFVNIPALNCTDADTGGWTEN